MHTEDLQGNVQERMWRSHNGLPLQNYSTVPNPRLGGFLGDSGLNQNCTTGFFAAKWDTIH